MKELKAQSHRQNFAGAFLERYEEGPISATLVTAHKMGKKIDNTGVAKAVHR
ncbi:hypothetical protein DPMN_095630 [Dreissena polymorpha]|uniref:Uncharacterized protein n=1 Tax=Dreissena polymorpha TaxID=45954 RepID=A0A9D4L9Q5_DREPO|nr:hypothetical protein DPMN_095630 [Dreissena polymorpha]